MSTIANFLFVIVVLFNLVGHGLCTTCANEDIRINTTKSGRVVEGKPEWKVVVTNKCKCPQAMIKITCKGFSSVEKVSSSVFSQIDADRYLLIKGGPLASGASVSFNYAWTTPYDMSFVGSQIVPC